MLPAQQKLGAYWWTQVQQLALLHRVLLQTSSLAQHLPPLYLTTATGQAVETYGLRKVHLQSRGLSLEVSFVIADVVTPLLGLDSMIKASLSLHIEHDLQHFLVNPAGDRTQLEHMGRRLLLDRLSISAWFVSMLHWQLCHM